MAGYSREFCEKQGLDFEPDFSIVEVFNQLEEGFYTSIICEGYGFIGIGREEGKCMLIYNTSSEEHDFILLEELDKYYLEKFKK